MSERSSFKIFVGVFPPKNIASVGNSITIYQTSAIAYYPATILDNPQIINESYDQNDCENTILGCDENFIVPPPPDNCGGGTQGPPGPMGPQGPQGLPGTGGGSRIYCGTLGGPPEPPVQSGVNMSCLLNENGYVVNVSNVSCGFNINQSDAVFRTNFYYRAAPPLGGDCGPGYASYNFSNRVLCGGTYNQCQGTYGIPQLETMFRKTGENTYAQQWTFEQFLIMQYGYNNGNIPDFSIESRSNIVSRAKGAGTGYIFIPTGTTWRSGDNYNWGEWIGVLSGVGSDAPEGTPGQSTASAIIDQNPGCGPEQPSAPPPITNAGASICTSAQSQSGGSCGSCPEGSGLDPTQCADLVKAGDVFIDATNGVMYFATQNGGFAAQGIPLAGEAACDNTGCPTCPEIIDGGGGGINPCNSCCPDCPSICPEGQECAQIGCPGPDGVSDENGDPCPCSVEIGEGGPQAGTYTCCPENWSCAPPVEPCPSGNYPLDPCCECAIEVDGQTTYVNKVCPCPEGQKCREEPPACNSCCGTVISSSSAGGLTGGL